MSSVVENIELKSKENDISPRMPPSTWKHCAAKDSRCGWMTSFMVPKSMSSVVENIELKSKEKNNTDKFNLSVFLI